MGNDITSISLDKVIIVDSKSLDMKIVVFQPMFSSSNWIVVELSRVFIINKTHSSNNATRSNVPFLHLEITVATIETTITSQVIVALATLDVVQSGRIMQTDFGATSIRVFVFVRSEFTIGTIIIRLLPNLTRQTVTTGHGRPCL